MKPALQPLRLLRDKRARVTSVAQLIAKVISATALLVAFPIVDSQLGPELFGVWVTIVSFQALLSFADMGIGNGLISEIAGQHSRGNEDACAAAVSSATGLLCAAAGALLVLGGVTVLIVDWKYVFNLSSVTASDEARRAVSAFLVCFALSIPASLLIKVYLALQMGVSAALVSAAGAAASLLGLGIAAALGAPLWVSVSIVVSSAPVATIASLTFTRRRLPNWFGRNIGYSHSVARQLFKIGSAYFVLQFAAAIATNIDNLLLSHYSGAAQVGDYAIAARLFSLVTVFLTVWQTPLWPAYAEAAARNDYTWIQRTLKKSIVQALLFGLAGIAVVMTLFDPIVTRWMLREVDAGLGLRVAMAAWVLAVVLGNAVAMYLNGLGMLRFQVWTALAFLALSIPTKILAIQCFGDAGLPVAGVLCYLVTTLIPYGRVLQFQRRDT